MRVNCMVFTVLSLLLLIPELPMPGAVLWKATGEMTTPLGARKAAMRA